MEMERKSGRLEEQQDILPIVVVNSTTDDMLLRSSRRAGSKGIRKPAGGTTSFVQHHWTRYTEIVRIHYCRLPSTLVTKIGRNVKR
jgi:hypothetical protein